MKDLLVVNGLNSKYVLLDLVTGKEKVFHVSDMKPFVFDPAVVDPLDTARREYMETLSIKLLIIVEYQKEINSQISCQLAWLCKGK